MRRLVQENNSASGLRFDVRINMPPAPYGLRGGAVRFRHQRQRSYLRKCRIITPCAISALVFHAPPPNNALVAPATAPSLRLDVALCMALGAPLISYGTAHRRETARHDGPWRDAGCTRRPNARTLKEIDVGVGFFGRRQCRNLPKVARVFDGADSCLRRRDRQHRFC